MDTKEEPRRSQGGAEEEHPAVGFPFDTDLCTLGPHALITLCGSASCVSADSEPHVMYTTPQPGFLAFSGKGCSHAVHTTPYVVY